MAESYLQRQQRLEGAKSQLQNAYRTHLGRDGSDDELLSHLGGGQWFDPQNVNFAIGNIANSEEARNRRVPRQEAPSVDSGAPAAGGGPPPPAGPAHLRTAASASGGGGGYAPVTASLPALKPISGGPGRVFVQPSSVYERGTLAAAHAANPITQFQGPDLGGVDDATEAHITALLNNPYSLSDTTVHQLKNREKEAAVSVADQLRGANAVDVAGRGFSAQGGMRAGADALVDAGLIDSLINSNREIDLAKAATDRSDLLNVLDASEGFQTGRVGRATNIYGAQLSGEQAREGQRQHDNSNLLQRFLAEEGTKQAEDVSKYRNDEFRYSQMKDDRAQTLAEWLAEETAQLNRLRTDIGASQFDMNFGENQRQFNNNTAFNYSSLNADSQARLMDQVCRIIQC